VYASDARVIDNTSAQIRTSLVEIPITCYQVIGVPDKAEKDEIVKSVMHLKNAEIEEGYTMDVVESRQNLLMDVRDKLLFEEEYAGNIREKVPPKSSLRIPWSWLPGALCLLQEVGEEKRVLEIGRTALQHPDAKPYIHDLLLSMSLAECANAKVNFEKNNISHGFEALARAQRLLRSEKSLENMTLLSQIEESLEELAPACTLELLGFPNIPENAERRVGAIAALREFLRQGLDFEATCQVQDWPGFLNQALNKLLAAEIVELLAWDNLSTIRKNKKSLESQNQRTVIDFSCFYKVLIAHIALGFSCKQPDLINRAKGLCESLIASEGIDLKFEEIFCSFLLGQNDEAAAAEKLRQIETISSRTSQNLLPGNEIKEASTASQSLESWLKDDVLDLFPDTRDCSPSLEKYFNGKKATTNPNKQNKRSPQAISNINHRPLSSALSSDRRSLDDHFSFKTSHLGPAVKQLATSNDKTSGESSNGNLPPVQLKRTLGAHRNNAWDIWFGPTNLFGNAVKITALGCILFATFKLIRTQFRRMRFNAPVTCSSSLEWSRDSTLDRSNSGSIANRLKKLLVYKMQLSKYPKAADLKNSSAATSLLYKRPMDIDEAEALVKQWQSAKAEALGPNHLIQNLFDVLDEPMLAQWQDVADAAKTRSCFWRFVLLQLSVIRAEISSDGLGKEMAEIEAHLEEAAELVDVSQPKNPNYYSTYKIRYVLKKQEDGSWRFCEADIESSS
jgi:hypothetical protein